MHHPSIHHGMAQHELQAVRTRDTSLRCSHACMPHRLPPELCACAAAPMPQALAAMVKLELPHVNLLTKLDLLQDKVSCGSWPMASSCMLAGAHVTELAQSGCCALCADLKKANHVKCVGERGGREGGAALGAAAAVAD